MAEALLRLEGVEIGYSGPLIPPLTLSLQRGKCLLIYGPNGAGKSTILRTMFGLQKPLSGAISWMGSPAAPRPRTLVKAGIRMLGQGNRGFDRLSASAQESVLNDLYGWAPKHREWLDLRRVGSLSFGQRRLAALRALDEGRLTAFLLDEPFAGLDLQATQEVADWCAARVKAGIALIIAEHRVVPLLPIIDDLLFIEGRLFRYIEDVTNSDFTSLGIEI